MMRAARGHVRDGTALPPDQAHESHREFTSGPAQAELRSRVRLDRRRLPRILRTCLWGALGLSGLSGLLIVLLAIFDPHTLGVLGQMLGLSFLVGREAAMLYAYSHHPAWGPVWILVAAAVEDLLILTLTLPLVWMGLERLRNVYFLGGVLLSLEKTAVEKRALLRRWGLFSLVAFVWFPGVGAGVFLAAVIGLVSKIPLQGCDAPLCPKAGAKACATVPGYADPCGHHLAGVAKPGQRRPT